VEEEYSMYADKLDLERKKNLSVKTKFTLNYDKF